MPDMSQYLAENCYGFLPVLLAITEPAIGYGGGTVGLFYTARQPEGRCSLFLRRHRFLAAATQNGNWLIGGGHRHTGSMIVSVTGGRRLR